MSDTSETIERIRRRLLARRAELEQRSRAVSADLQRQDDPLAADFAEQATQRENDDVLGAVRASATVEAAAIAAAIARLASGTYGDCSRCGAAIEPARLEAVPYTTRCVRCADALEAQTPRPVAKSAY